MTFDVTVRLLGHVEAESREQVEQVINQFLDSIGEYGGRFVWPDAEWSIQEYQPKGEQHV